MADTPKEHGFYLLSMELASASAMMAAAFRCAAIVRENNPADSGIADEIEREFGIMPKKDHDYVDRQWDVFGYMPARPADQMRFLGTVESMTHPMAHIRAINQFGKDAKVGEAISIRPKPAVEWSVLLVDVDNPVHTKRAGTIWATDWDRAMKSASRIHAADIEKGFGVTVTKTKAAVK